VKTGIPPLFFNIFSDSSRIIGPPAFDNLPATPPPCCKIPLAALTMTSVSSLHISPLTTEILTPL